MRYQLLSWCRCFQDTSSLVLLFLCPCVWYPFPTTRVPISGVPSRCTSTRWVKSVQLLFPSALGHVLLLSPPIWQKSNSAKNGFQTSWWVESPSEHWFQGRVRWKISGKTGLLLGVAASCCPSSFVFHHSSFHPHPFFSSFPHLRSPVSCCLTSHPLSRVLSLYQR